MGGMLGDWDGESVISSSTRRSRSHHHKTSKSRDSSRSHKSSKSKRHSGLAGFFGVDGGHHSSSHSIGGSHYNKHNSSRGSFFGLGNGSTRSFFSLGRSNSYYKRQPRSSFLQRTLKKLKRLLRDLMYYAKRHPIKVFMLVIMPLITGGALTALLARFGLRLPPSIERMLGIAARAGSGDSVGFVGEAVRMAGGLGRGDSVSVGRDHHGEYQWERRREYYDEGRRGGGGGFFDGIRDFFS